ncbi:ABC transporter permease [Dysgonomonas macrotermitis]|uniref:MacB-like core domain-containing protein n=1 Tax=Dysgonomonas macrotermitis TaxID=1346286 RepID=A0A1M5G6K1_9BACT|nr:ABC transporter permease [Dysgonomonas macrotermitis]SHF99346.1 MacB-like core domain-containing protein [Dysgonomonas macrotermitis]
MLKLFIRNFVKQKTVGILNISSLSLGIMVSVIVGLWTIQSFSFDNFHTNGNRIYRSITQVKVNGVENLYPSIFKPYGEEAIAKYPDIEAMCRVVINYNNEEVWVGNQIYPDSKTLIADNNFFTVFTFPIIEGDNAASVIDSPDKVVISEKAAKRLFPGENAIGKTI